MEFDFLPNLPKANLDDRRFEELMEECLLRIPRYCPEWTNFNPSDPGVTLIELYAWLTDQMLYRFNQLPRRYYVQFLEMLGLFLQAPTPAHTEVTFYLSAALSSAYTIPRNAEVATLRTEEEEAIVFSTDQHLTVGTPRIRHVLTAPEALERPQILRDRLGDSWTMDKEGRWSGLETDLFQSPPEEGNCFYVVLEPNLQIIGNVIALNFQGSAATATGIDPDQPPRHWEAWNGESWQRILIADTDDHTEGFSFSTIKKNGGDPLQGVDVILHLPLQWPVTQFVTYEGHWLRCVYQKSHQKQPGYGRSPRFVGIHSRSIGGTVRATQSTLIRNEIVGESNGKPGQKFPLQGQGILPRQPGEYLLVTPPGGLPQAWKEVENFAQSQADDLHYTLDSVTGIIQFGPLIRESGQLQEQIQWRSRFQHRSPGGNSPNPGGDRQGQERQYGAVPPRGAEIQMVAYRLGGGHQGNVQRGTIRIMKTAIPYVSSVINHQPATNGADAESIDELVLRVPRLLRARDRAVTNEDFEYLALVGSGGAIARSRCLSPQSSEDKGRVKLLLVPAVNTEQLDQGIEPHLFQLSEPLKQRVASYIDERRLLGVDVSYGEPQYVGVSVQAEVALEPEYQNPRAQSQLARTLTTDLYRFFNPICGGGDGQGWPFGRPVHNSDVVNLLQNTKGVRYLRSVKLHELRYHASDDRWERSLAKGNLIDPGPLGLICSWRDDVLRSSHLVNII